MKPAFRVSKLHFYPFEGSSFSAGEQRWNHFLDSLAHFTHDASQYAAVCLITSFSTFCSHRFAVPQDCGSTDETGKSSDCFDSNDDWCRGCLWCQQRPRINKSRRHLHLFGSKTALSTGEQSLHAQAQPYLLQLRPTEVWEEGEIAASLLTICRSCYMRKCWMHFFSQQKWGKKNPRKRKWRKIKSSVVPAFAGSWVAFISTATHRWGEVGEETLSDKYGRHGSHYIWIKSGDQNSANAG